MPEILGAFIVVLLMIVVVAIVGGWAFISIGRGLLRMIFGRSAKPASRWGDSSPEQGACVHPNCQGNNPAHAQFCRRCGAPLPGASRMGARRVA